MATQLLINTEDLKRLSQLSGNIDDDKLIQYVKIAQDTQVKNYLGTDLLERFQAGLTASNLTTDETNLLNDYIKDMVVHWTLVVALKFQPYTIANNGVFKKTSENAETVSKEEMDSIIQKHREVAVSYSDAFINYMCYNSSTFPEYDSNTDADTDPRQKTNYISWVL